MVARLDIPQPLRSPDSPKNVDSHASRRYVIWGMQVEAGHEPCFGTAVRFVCDEYECPFRKECLGLRAHWRG